MPKLYLTTYGCQMNEYDSERVAGLLKRSGYELTEEPGEADLVLLNTCAIREKAEDKVCARLGQLSALKRQRPDLLIGVMGCMAQLWQGKILDRTPQVDLVFGSAAVARVGELVERARATGGPVLETGEAPLVKITAKPERPGQPKAFVTVMEGCQKFCTFCVVPMTRGRERSHFTTSNPYNLTPRLIRAIRDVPKVVEYLHLPLQSGSDRVLARMNRGYTRARYLELIAELEETVPGIALSTDLIVGFPGEEEGDFEQTADMVERVGYDNVFVFRYSRRPGTPAATMLDQVPEEIKAQRNSRLLEVATRVGAARSRALEGRVLPILVDGVSRKNPDEATGRTRGNRVVNFDAHGRRLLGEVVPVLITQALPHSLRGELAGAGAEGRVLATAAV